MKISPFLSVLCFSFGFFLQVSNAQIQVNIIASKDNTLYEDAAGALSNGKGAHFFAGRVGFSGQTEIRRGLIAFDLAGIPAEAVIDSVKLKLSVSNSNSEIQVLQLFRVLADWGEGASNASEPGGRGAPATPNDATWIHRFFNTSTWTRAGGDFATTASASQTVGRNLGFYTWGSTPQMAADVQRWLDTPASNFGWLLLGNESAAMTAKRFDSREHTTPANRPTLTVFYRLQTSVAEHKLETPSQFHLAQNYPNPFSSVVRSSAIGGGNPSTTIRFYLPTAAPATLQILDVSGRVIVTLVDGKINAGEHEVQWNAANVAGGIYFYRLQAGELVQTKKLILLK